MNNEERAKQIVDKFSIGNNGRQTLIDMVAGALDTAVAAERGRAEPLVNAVVACFNRRGVQWAERKGNEDISDLADALSDYGHSLALEARHERERAAATP
ncbi:MAG: hypothetical protein IPK75_18095 [Acidobacteria bacterium]|nr:hypothetical protein [Acidobacteriota bacterium]